MSICMRISYTPAFLRRLGLDRVGDAARETSSRTERRR